MLNGRLWTGDTFQAGELGHMILIPGGRRCYCGKQGCADAYLSPRALKRDGWETYSPVSGRNTAARWAPPNLGWSSLEIKCSDVFSACKADGAAKERYR